MKRHWHFISAVLKIIFRHPILGVTLVPVLPNGDIVLVFRRDTKQWSLPGGMVDWGQDIPTTIARELKEETGLDLVRMGRLVGVYSAHDRDPRLHSISILIETQVTGEMKVKDTWEILDVKAFSQENLPLGNLAHDHDRQLQDYFKTDTPQIN